MIQPAARSLSPDYLKKKCQIKPYSQDQWQLANFVVGFKSIIQKVQSLMEIELDSFLTTVGPRTERPRAERTSELNGFQLGPK